jgi:hypothetical protein
MLGFGPDHLPGPELAPFLHRAGIALAHLLLLAWTTT